MSLQKIASSMTVLLTAGFLVSCASSTPREIVRPTLPPAPENFGKPVTLPKAMSGASLRRFALENRAAAIAANQRLMDDAAFYEDVLSRFGNNALGDESRNAGHFCIHGFCLN